MFSIESYKHKMQADYYIRKETELKQTNSDENTKIKYLDLL